VSGHDHVTRSEGYVVQPVGSGWIARRPARGRPGHGRDRESATRYRCRPAHATV